MGEALEGKPSAGSNASLSSARARIAAAFDEASEGPRDAGSKLTVRTYPVDFKRPDYRPDDFRRVRDLLGMSQVVVARFLGVGPNTVLSWEQGTRPPSAIARRFMCEIEGDLDY